MYLNEFHDENNNLITITPEQGSRFAKEISDDFNPLHNPDSKRFCVPGDLLFALTLARLGLSKKMSFKYTRMVGKGVKLKIPATDESEFTILDLNDKAYLNVQREGDTTTDMDFIEGFSKAYVAFSGHSFPHILVPLMQDNNVMINPKRPLVIYEQMVFEFSDLKVAKPILMLVGSQLKVTGKRGIVRIDFNVIDGRHKVGEGYKTMLLSGLREYDQTKIDDLIVAYNVSNLNYTASRLCHSN